VFRVLREWDLAHSAPSSPLARACALHLLCRDAGFCRDAGMMVLAGLGVCSVILLAAVRAFGLCASEPFRSSQPACACLCTACACQDPGVVA
jgi:hypothetical protein